MERWKLNLYTLWVTQVFSLMGIGLCIPFTPFYLQEMGLTDPDQLSYYVGMAFTLPAATMAVAAPIWGIASDRYGRKVMIMRAMLCAAILLILMGLVTDVWQFMLLRAMQGIFTGTITASMSFVSANTPENRMSYALGLMTSSNFLGLTIGPLVGGMLAEIVGYKTCFFIGSALMATGFLLVVFLVKEDSNSFGYQLRTHDDQKGKKLKVFTPFIMVVLLTLLFQRIVRTVFLPFVPLFVQQTLGTVTGAATYTGVINGAAGLATAVAALTITRLGDRHDKLKLAFLLTTISIPVSLLLIPQKPLFLFTIVFASYYLMVGASEPILTSAASQRTPASIRGALFGMIGTVGSLGAMVSPMIGSYISVQFSVEAILFVIPIFALAQFICLYNAKRIGKKEEQETEMDEEDR